MVVSKKFWKNRKVLITGASGFVGSKLSLALFNLGAQVIAVVRPGTQKSSLSGISAKIKITACNLSDMEQVKKLFLNQTIDTVFHLAASPIVSQVAMQPHLSVENNVLSTLNILEVCRLNKVKRVLLASSDKVYGEHAKTELESLPFKESYALRGLDIYSASKVCADTLAQAYAYQYRMLVAVLRCGNIYGPGDVNFTRLIPRTIMLLLSGRAPVIKAGHEKVLREYLYIDDAVSAYIFLAEKLETYYGLNLQNMPKVGKQTYGWLAFNVGSYNRSQTKKLSSCTNIQNVTQIIKLLSKKIRFIQPVVVLKPPKYIEIPNEYLDSTKILQLGFKTRVTLEQGIENSVVWYKDNFQSLKSKFLKQVSA